jgi:hypothetical protein
VLLTSQNLIRVFAAALALSTLSFAAGVAGDLSLAEPPNHGERVVLRLPPELPPDAARAAPLPPLLSTTSAEALPPQAPPRREPAAIVEATWKPPHEQVHSAPKDDPDRAPKPEEPALI